MDVLFPPLQAPFEIARNPAFIVSAAGRTCLRPRGDLRRVGEKSAVGLALPNPYRPIVGSRCSRPQTLPRVKKHSRRTVNNEGVLACYI